MALTKADMAEKLYEELGLNKREAKELVEMFFEEVRSALEEGDQVNCRDLAILICGIKTSGLAAIQRLAKRYPSRHDVW